MTKRKGNRDFPNRWEAKDLNADIGGKPSVSFAHLRCGEKSGLVGQIREKMKRETCTGSSDPVKIQPHSLRTPSTVTISNNLPDAHPGNQGPGVETDISPAVRHFRYTSVTHRSYEEVGWVTKIQRHLKAPETTLEKLADPVSERASLRRYNSRPQLWQSVGAEWSTRQLRLTNDAKKPISFCSTYPRSGQIPLYTGTIGSHNMDNIDNMDEDFHPLTLKRSIVPPYTPTARRTTIPGYTGKAAYADSAAASACSSGTISSEII